MRYIIILSLLIFMSSTAYGQWELIDKDIRMYIDTSSIQMVKVGKDTVLFSCVTMFVKRNIVLPTDISDLKVNEINGLHASRALYIRSIGKVLIEGHEEHSFDVFMYLLNYLSKEENEREKKKIDKDYIWESDIKLMQYNSTSTDKSKS